MSSALSSLSSRPDWSGAVNALMASTPLIDKLSEIVADYLFGSCVEAIGPKELEKMWGIQTEQRELGPEFYKWWYGPDAHDQLLARTNPSQCIRRNCETFHLPVLRSRSITHLDSHTAEDLTFHVIQRLGKNPKSGYYPVECVVSSRHEVLEGYKKYKAGPTRYICMRKESLAQGTSEDAPKKLIEQLNTQEDAGYEKESSSLDLLFVPAAIHAFTGVPPHGNASCERRGTMVRYTLGFCFKERIAVAFDQNTVTVGYKVQDNMWYIAESDYDYGCNGVTPLKFF